MTRSIRFPIVRIATLCSLVLLSACGYSNDEYALNSSSVAPGVGVVGGPVTGVNPVSGELMGAGLSAGAGTSVRSLGNPENERYDPRVTTRR